MLSSTIQLSESKHGIGGTAQAARASLVTLCDHAFEVTVGVTIVCRGLA
jgi:hypothetical protein